MMRPLTTVTPSDDRDGRRPPTPSPSHIGPEFKLSQCQTAAMVRDSGYARRSRTVTRWYVRAATASERGGQH
jgi:hypothetical protein